MGFGEIADEALLKSGEEALGIGFPLDGPVRDATLLCLNRQRRAHQIVCAPRYIEFLERVQFRYPTAYEALARQYADHLTSRSLEIGQIPLLMQTM